MILTQPLFPIACVIVCIEAVNSLLLRNCRISMNRTYRDWTTVNIRSFFLTNSVRNHKSNVQLFGIQIVSCLNILLGAVGFMIAYLRLFLVQIIIYRNGIEKWSEQNAMQKQRITLMSITVSVICNCVFII